MTEEIPKTTNSTNSYLGWIVLILIILGLTLPFHYAPDSMKMFPKDHFTFKNTIITQNDIDEIIKRYNKSTNIFQQSTINNDPLIRTLKEQGIIYDIDKKNINDDTEK